MYSKMNFRQILTSFHFINVTEFRLKILDWFPLFSKYAQWSQAAIFANSDYTDNNYRNPRWTWCTVWVEYGSLSFYEKYTLHLMKFSTFAAYVS